MNDKNDKSDKKVDHSNEKKNEANENRPKDLRETIENKKATKVSGSQSNPDFKSTNRKKDRSWIFMIYIYLVFGWSTTIAQVGYIKELSTSFYLDTAFLTSSESLLSDT